MKYAKSILVITVVICPKCKGKGERCFRHWMGVDWTEKCLRCNGDGWLRPSAETLSKWGIT